MAESRREAGRRHRGGRYAVHQFEDQPLEKRVDVFGRAVFGLILATLLSGLFLSGYFIKNFNHFFGVSYLQSDVLSQLGELDSALASYVHYQDEEVRAQIGEKLDLAEEKLQQFKEEQTFMDEEQWMLTRAILKTGETYRESIRALLDMPSTEPQTQEFYIRYYETLEIGEYVDTYLSQLIQLTLQGGREEYIRQSGLLWWMLVVSAMFLVAALGLLIHFRNWIGREIVTPVLALADASRTLVSRNMDIPDLEVRSGNEIGELTAHFNKMKEDCRSLIRTQAERANLAKNLFEENIRRIDAEKQLSVTRFAMLRSQINPHFLFNTLNLIAQTANQEQARETMSLLKRLSDLLRYNLYNTRDQVLLRQELEVLRSYMYIQESRFRDRLLFWVECDVDTDMVRIPSFTLQPLVENAISHGIAPRQEGGLVRVKITQRPGWVRIAVTDNGVGMDPERLRAVRRGDMAAVETAAVPETAVEAAVGPETAVDAVVDAAACNDTDVTGAASGSASVSDCERQTACRLGTDSQEIKHSGIGIDNVRNRLLLLYPKGQFRIYSRQGWGTSIVIRFPLTDQDQKEDG